MKRTVTDNGGGTENRSVLVVMGATGAVGRAAVHTLAGSLHPASTLVLVGRRKTALEALAEEIQQSLYEGVNLPRLLTHVVELRDEGTGKAGSSNQSLVADALEDINRELSNAECQSAGEESLTQILLNAAGPSSRLSEGMARAALEQGFHYIDVGGCQRIIDGISESAASARRHALFGCGVQPGLTGALLSESARLLSDPEQAEVSMVVGGRQQLTAGALQEYVDSFTQDGGWPRSVWSEGEVKSESSVASDQMNTHRHGLASEDRLEKHRGCFGPSPAVSSHLDEEYVAVARRWRIGHLSSGNVMDAPRTVAAMQRFIAGEYSAEDVAACGRHEPGERYFAISAVAQDPAVTVRAECYCADSYELSGQLTALCALWMLRTSQIDAEPGAYWAALHPSSRAWLHLECVSLSVDMDAATSAHSDVIETSENEHPRAAVVGANFGAHYARGIADPASPVALAAVVGRGGHAGRQLASELETAYVVASPGSDVPAALDTHVDVAVIAVPSQVAGGDGDDIAAQFLDAGTPVIQEMPVDPQVVADQLRRARLHRTTYRVTGFYEHTAPARAFIAAVHYLHEQAEITHVTVRTCYQVLDRAALLLSEALDGVPVGHFRAQDMADPAWKMLSGQWGMRPVDVLLKHQMDPNDPDNGSQPFMHVVVETPDGELTWHGPADAPRWQQLPHSYHSVITEPAGKVRENWCTDFLDQWPQQWVDVVDSVWPSGVQRAVHGTLWPEEGQALAQEHRRTLLVLRWWKDVMDALPTPLSVEVKKPRLIRAPALSRDLGEAQV